MVWLQEGTVTGHCWHYWQRNPQITEVGQRNSGYKEWKLELGLHPELRVSQIPNMFLKTGTTGKILDNKTGPKKHILCSNLLCS